MKIDDRLLVTIGIDWFRPIDSHKLVQFPQLH